MIGALVEMAPEEEAMSDLLLPDALLMSNLADAGFHDVAGDRFSEFVSTLQRQDLRHGVMLHVLATVAGDEPNVSEYHVARLGLRHRIRHPEAGAGHHRDGAAAGAGLGEAGQGWPGPWGTERRGWA